jgi:phosphoglucomutase
MLEAVARGHGIRFVNTLTGFKWMGAKLQRYENELRAGLAAAGDRRTPAEIAALPPRERAALRLRHSAWLVLAAEESYGCLAGDAARDKDANAAALMCAELAAWLSASGQTARDALNQLYAQHGYHAEALRTLTFEGAAGAAQIQRVLASLRANPPALLGGRAVERVQDFLQPGRMDEEGEAVPLENFLLYHLAGGWRCAIRGSGTEPKVKIYFLMCAPAGELKQLDDLRRTVNGEGHEWIEKIVNETAQRADS